MRRIGIVLGLVVALAGVLLVGGWLVLRRIDWNAYLQPIADRTWQATGRRLDLEGDLDLQIGLRPGVRIADVTFQNADWGSRPEMATLQHLVFQFALLPLLSGELVVDRIELVGLDLLLETGEDGRSNWELARPEADVPAPHSKELEESDAPDTDTVGPAEALATQLRHLDIRNAMVVLLDAETGESQRFTIRRLLATSPAPDAALSVELDALRGADPIRVVGEIEGVRDLMAGGPLGLSLRIEAAGARLEVQGEVTAPLENARFDLELAFQADRLAELSELLATDLPDLGPIALDTGLEGGGGAWALHELELSIGRTRLGGTLDLSFDGPRPRVEARLAAPLLDIADLQPRSGRASAGRARGAPGIRLVAQTAPDRVFSDEPLPIERLGALDASIRLDTDRLVANGVVLDELGAQLELQGAKLVVAPFEATLAKGRLDLALTLDASAASPAVSLRGTAREVVVGDLARAWGIETIEDGPLALDLDLRSRGRSLHEIASALDGRVELSMGQAVLHHETASLLLSDLRSLLRGRTDDATLDCVFGEFELAKGVARPQGWVIDLGSIALFGTGAIDLGRERLDLQFDRQARGVSASGALPPFALKGSLLDPKAHISTSALVDTVVDLGADLLGVDLLGVAKVRDRESVVGCRELLARYSEERDERDSRTRDTTRDLGEKASEQGQKVIDMLQDLWR